MPFSVIKCIKYPATNDAFTDAIINAKKIYCVESAFHQFMDGVIPFINNIPKLLSIFI